MDAVNKRSGEYVAYVVGSSSGGAFLGGGIVLGTRREGAGCCSIPVGMASLNSGLEISVSGSSSNKGSKEMSDFASESTGGRWASAKLDSSMSTSDFVSADDGGGSWEAPAVLSEAAVITEGLTDV